MSSRGPRSRAAALFGGRLSTVPHVPRHEAWRDAREMVQNPVAVFEKYRLRLGPIFSFHFGGVRRALVLTDADAIEHVLQRNRDNYPKSTIQVDRMVEFQGMGLVNSHGDTWQRERRLMGKGFRSSSLTRLLPLQREALDQLLAELSHDAAMGPVDVHQQMVRFTLRLVGRTLFGSSMSRSELDQIGDTITRIQGFIVRQIVQPYLIPWYRLSGQTTHFQRLRRAADRIVLGHVHARSQLGSEAYDLLQVLLETPYHDTGQALSEDQVRIESLQLLVAGNETSSNALTWTLYLLARHPRVLQNVQQEIDDAMAAGREDDDAPCPRLPLTARVLSEALRLYPPFWMIDRVARSDDTIGGTPVPAGTMVIPYIYGTHRNPDYWHDAERFDPDRFLLERRRDRPVGAYIPFGAGPRVCIGNSLALQQAQLVLMALLGRYDISLVSDTPVRIQPMMLLRPRGPVMMHFAPRAQRRTAEGKEDAPPCRNTGVGAAIP